MEIPGIGLRLFGYNISEVNEELSRVDREFYETLCDLEIKTCKYLDENQKLKEEIRALKRNRGSSALQPDFLEAAVKSAGRFIELYQGYVNEEAERLRENEQRITQLYNEKLAAIDREIKSTQKIIGMALESILNKTSEISLDDLAEETSAHPKALEIAEIAEIAGVKTVAAREPYWDSAPDTEYPVSEHNAQYSAPGAKEIAAVSAVEDALKAALPSEAPQTEAQTESPPAVSSKGVSWYPIPKIDYISPLTLEDFEESQKAPPTTDPSVSASTAVPVSAAPAPPVPASDPVSVYGLQSFRLSAPQQAEAEKSALE